MSSIQSYPSLDAGKHLNIRSLAHQIGKNLNELKINRVQSGCLVDKISTHRTVIESPQKQFSWNKAQNSSITPIPLQLIYSSRLSQIPLSTPRQNLQTEQAEKKQFYLSYWGRFFGPGAYEREQHLKELGTIAPEGALKKFFLRSLRYLSHKPLNYALSFGKKFLDRATFFYQGQGLLQDMSQKEALFMWYKEFRERFAREDQKKTLPDITDHTGIDEPLFKSLQIAVMAELKIEPDKFFRSQLENNLLTTIAKVTPQAHLLRAILPENNTSTQPLDQVLSIDILDKIEALVKNPFMRQATLLVALPTLHSFLEKLQNLSKNTPQIQPHLEKIVQNFTHLNQALLHSPEQIEQAFKELRATLKNLPAVSIEGVRVLPGQQQQIQEVAPSHSANVLSPDELLSHSFRPQTVEIAKEITDGTVLRFIETFSGFSTVSLVNLFLDKTDTKYDYPSILKSAETAAPNRAVMPKDIIHQLQKKIKEDSAIGWFQRFVFGTKWILQFFFWFSEKLIGASSYSTVAELRSDLEHLKERRESKNMLLFELLNKSLSNMVGMYQYVADSKPGQGRATGSLEKIMNDVSNHSIFYNGLSEQAMKTKVANRIVSTYLPKIELEGGFLKMIKGIPGESLLKLFTPIVKLLDYFPNKLIAWFSSKLLKQTDAVGLIMESVTTKTERSTQLELTIYRSLHEELARAYQSMKNPSAEDQSPTLLRPHEMKEIQSLCNHIIKVSRLKRFTTADQVRDYFRNPPMMEKLEELLIDKNKEVLNELFMSIYNSITNDISIETQINSIFDSAISSVESNATVSQESLQLQIASERSSIDRLMRGILQISIDKGVDAALTSKPLQTESMEKIQKILSLSSIKEELTRLQTAQNPVDRKKASIQMNTLIRSITRQILLLSEQESLANKLAPQDKELYLSRLKEIHTSLAGAFKTSCELMDHFITKTLPIRPHNLKQIVSQINEDFTAIAQQNSSFKKELLERIEARLSHLRNITLKHSHLLSQFSKGHILLNDLHGIYTAIENHIQNLKNPNAQLQEVNLEPELDRIQTWCESFDVLMLDTTKEQNLKNLNELFSEDSSISKLTKEPLEKKEVEISLLKDSTILRKAKETITEVLNGYLDEVINHLTDPMIHKVAVKTALSDFAGQTKN